MKILVVDDDSVVLDSCRRVLEAEGFEVYLASSAEMALDAMENGDLDLLLIDVKMPERDGMYLMREVKGKWPKVPIIVMSGYPTPETIADGIKMGGASFIAKPFTPDELLETIHQVMQKDQAHESNESSGN